eukprot:scaffold249_cov405-Prasinococcus_capsulatus_cf.AAC.5
MTTQNGEEGLSRGSSILEDGVVFRDPPATQSRATEDPAAIWVGAAVARAGCDGNVGTDDEAGAGLQVDVRSEEDGVSIALQRRAQGLQRVNLLNKHILIRRGKAPSHTISGNSRVVGGRACRKRVTRVDATCAQHSQPAQRSRPASQQHKLIVAAACADDARLGLQHPWRHLQMPGAVRRPGSGASGRPDHAPRWPPTAWPHLSQQYGCVTFQVLRNKDVPSGVRTGPIALCCARALGGGEIQGCDVTGLGSGQPRRGLTTQDGGDGRAAGEQRGAT